MKREKILRDMYIKLVQLNAKTKDIFQETLTYISFCIQILVNRKCSSFVNSYEGHNSVTNCLIVPKTELNLDVLMINLYSKFHFSMYNLCEECERKLLVN